MKTMEGFSCNNAVGETLGAVLRSGREAAGVSVEELSNAVRIQEKHLIALEAGDYRALPETVYQRMFVQAVARVLGLDQTALLAMHAEEVGESIGISPSFSKPPCRKPRLGFVVMPRVIAAATVACLAISSLAILGHEVYRIIAAPAVELTSPADGESVASASVGIRGKTERGAELRVNGELVYLAPDGSFEEPVNLHRGVNVIKISAKKTHSDERVLYRRVLWESPENAGGGGAVSAVVTTRGR